MSDQPAKPIIRPATTADLETILEHRIAMLDSVFPPGSGFGDFAPAAVTRDANRDWIERHLGVDFFVWIAELDGRPAGSAAILWFEHPPSQVNPAGKEAYILNVYTDPEARRQGLAKALMGRLIDEACAAGVRRIWLRASEDGRSLYESLGFRPGNYLQLLID